MDIEKSLTTRAQKFCYRLVLLKNNKINQSIDGLKLGMGNILSHLYYSSEDMSAGDLGNALGISKPRVTVLLKKLVQRGYIVYREDSNDKRKTMVSITEQGKDYYEEENRKVLEYIEYLLESIGDEKMFSLIDILQEIDEVTAKYIKKE